MPDTAFMTKPPKKKRPVPPKAVEPEPRSKDRHKPSKMVRIRGALAAQLEKLAETNNTDPTEEANRAVREMLQREQLWPPKPP